MCRVCDKGFGHSTSYKIKYGAGVTNGFTLTSLWDPINMHPAFNSSYLTSFHRRDSISKSTEPRKQWCQEAPRRPAQRLPTLPFSSFNLRPRANLTHSLSVVTRCGLWPALSCPLGTWPRWGRGAADQSGPPVSSEGKRANHQITKLQAYLEPTAPKARGALVAGPPKGWVWAWGALSPKGSMTGPAASAVSPPYRRSMPFGQIPPGQGARTTCASQVLTGSGG